MNRWIIAFSGLLGACAVILGALGAHLWRTQLAPEMYATFTTALTYLLIHAVALLLVGVLVGQYVGNWWYKVAAILFVFGILLFSGGLILRSVTGLTHYGRFAPIGGVALILGWLTISLGGIFSRTKLS